MRRFDDINKFNRLLHFSFKDISYSLMSLVALVLVIAYASAQKGNIDQEFTYSQNDSYVPVTEKTQYTERDLLLQITRISTLSCPQSEIKISTGAIDISTLTANNAYGVTKFFVPNSCVYPDKYSFYGNTLNSANNTLDLVAKALALTDFVVKDKCFDIIYENGEIVSKSEKYTLNFTDILGRELKDEVPEETGTDNSEQFLNTNPFQPPDKSSGKMSFSYVPIVAPFDFTFVNSNVDNATGSETIIIENKSKTCKIVFNDCANWLCAGTDTTSDKWAAHINSQHNTPIGPNAVSGLTGGIAGSVIGYARPALFEDGMELAPTTITIYARDSGTNNYHLITFYEFLFNNTNLN